MRPCPAICFSLLDCAQGLTVPLGAYWLTAAAAPRQVKQQEAAAALRAAEGEVARVDAELAADEASAGRAAAALEAAEHDLNAERLAEEEEVAEREATARAAELMAEAARLEDEMAEKTAQAKVGRAELPGTGYCKERGGGCSLGGRRRLNKK